MWTEEEERYVSRIMGEMRDRLAETQEKVTGQDIVFATIWAAIDIERRMKVSGSKPQGDSSPWPHYIRTKDEIAHDIAQRWIDVAAGDPVDLVFGIRTEATPLEVSTMEAIHVVFKGLLKGKQKDRDWRILNLLTSPNASLRRIGKTFHITHSRVATVKVVQLQAIWDGVHHMLPGRQLDTGVVWRDETVAGSGADGI